MLGELVDMVSYSLLILTIIAVVGTNGYWMARFIKAKAHQEELGHFKKAMNGRRN